MATVVISETYTYTLDVPDDVLVDTMTSCAFAAPAREEGETVLAYVQRVHMSSAACERIVSEYGAGEADIEHQLVTLDGIDL